MLNISIPTVILSIMFITTVTAIALSYRDSVKHRAKMRGDKFDKHNGRMR